MKQTSQRYILGLDLGIASVGWAAVWVDEDENPVGLLDCGVRTFEKGETPDKGESLNKVRREKRGIRRLLDHRQERTWKLRQLLKKHGVLIPENFSSEKTIKGMLQNIPINAWQLRVSGLDRKLNRQEWAAVLLHLVKHRGYLSQRKNEKDSLSQTEKKGEKGGVLDGIEYTSNLLLDGQYRTPAEVAVALFLKQEGRIRNTTGFYQHTFNRLDFQTELHLLFERQRKFGNLFVSKELETQVDALLMAQRDALPDENAILSMMGKCTFEKAEPRAAKHTFSAERFIWLSKLSNLRIKDESGERQLSTEERNKIIDMPYRLSSVSYKQIRNELEGLGLPNTVFFNISYSKKNKKGEYKSREQIETDTLFMEMKAWHAIKNALEKNGCKTEWQSLATDFLLLDEIGTIFTLCKTDEKIREKLQDKLPKNVLDILVGNLNFTKPVQLSMKALGNLLPLMEGGKSYDEAWRVIYPPKDSEQKMTLPVIPADSIRNPVVLRTLSQARKVINAIIRRYGSPVRVHIETAGELGKSWDKRQEIKKQQDKNRDANDVWAKQFIEHFGFKPKRKDIIKLRLYDEQHGKCLYSGVQLDLNRLNDEKYVEIDHALPFSRTWDDSLNNKVLVLGSENQKKRNQTPYEYLNGAANSERWREFQARVVGSRFPFTKKQRIQMIKLDRKAEQGFFERNLNDTRYVSRFLCQFMKDNLKLADVENTVTLQTDITENQYWSKSKKQRVFSPNGQMTQILRHLWGLPKDRKLNDRHHALDAVVIACSTVSMQQKITKAMQRRETLETIDYESGEVKQRIPQPWDFFRQEVMIRVFSETPHDELAEKLSSRPEALHEFVTPLFVSRAPNRKMTGQGHLETVKSAKRLDEKISVVKKSLSGFKIKDIASIVGYPDREPAFYAALQERLEAFNDDPVKAFATPFYKPGKNGEQGALVKSVRIIQDAKIGLSVRKGITDTNGDMVRVDVFGKGGKNYLVPVYAWQVAKGILPNRAVVSYADEVDWDEMDKSYEFKFTLYPNDLVEVISKKGRIFGYYVGLNRATGAIDIREHDLAKDKGKNGVYQSVGVKTVLSFQKYQIDPLGKEIRPCKAEQRPELKTNKK